VDRGIKTTVGTTLQSVSFDFTVSSQAFPYTDEPTIDDFVPESQSVARKETAPALDTIRKEASDYVTVPDTFPAINVTTAADGTDDGYLFLSNWIRNQAIKDSYLLILDNFGEPIYYEALADGNRGLDLKRQPDGTLTYFDDVIHAYHVMDSSYEIIDTIQAGNGYETDHHGIQILPNGHALFMIYHQRPADLSDIGGRADAEVVDLIIQELDTSNNVIFEWNSADHIAYTDTFEDIDTAIVDYIHGNAVELDFDGNILISSRHLSEITKIDRQTGDVIWRLGGKQNEFTFENDEPFHYQHDIRRLANGNITLFDNRFGEQPRYSRALEYAIDEEEKTVTKVWEYRHESDVYAAAMGSHQRLPNGNSLIGWGTAETTLTEVTPAGDIAFELAFDPPYVSYRVFRFPWQGFPNTEPTLMTMTDDEGERLAYSWNGATEIDSYQVYGDAQPTSTTELETREKSGFETSTALDDVADDVCFFQVMPIDKEGEETRLSNMVYRGDDTCATGLTLSATETKSKVFTSDRNDQTFITELTAPTDALSESLVLIHDDVVEERPTPENMTLVGPHFVFNVYEDFQAFPDFVFAEPATVTVEYDDAIEQLLDEMDVELQYWDNELEEWTTEGLDIVSRDVDANRLTYTITQPGEFAVFGQAEEQISDTRLYLPLLATN
ncbi:MAG: arylsulfotransferase family protein, partial [Chloroflexota bacterium]